MLTNAELWKRIDTFELDDPNAAFQFTDRLAQENGWSKSFAKRAVQEYKRFVYLAAVSPTPVTPSDIVDQVWHLHLTFTRSYWDGLCNAVLGKPLHHGPTMGGRAEDAKYRNQYAATRALYRAEFGTEPPLEFWPPADARFASAPHQRWIDTRTHFVIRRPKLNARLTGGALAIVGAAGTAAAPDGAAGADNTSAIVVILVVMAVAAILLVSLFSGRWSRRGRATGKGDGGDGAFIASTTVGSPGGKGKGDGAEGGEGSGGEGGGDGGSGCGGGGGCSS